jgi:hypothetical protein
MNTCGKAARLQLVIALSNKYYTYTSVIQIIKSLQ